MNEIENETIDDLENYDESENLKYGRPSIFEGEYFDKQYAEILFRGFNRRGNKTMEDFVNENRKFLRPITVNPGIYRKIGGED